MSSPVHGYCVVCKGGIPRGVNWTLTGQLNRVHADPDDCIAKLRPHRYAAFMKVNPRYVSRERYEVVR